MNRSDRKIVRRQFRSSWVMLVVGCALGIAPRWASATVYGSCSGDCSGDGEVTINEVLMAVNMGLGTTAVTACPAADTNGDGSLTIAVR